jgi:chromosomal replication initiator protein
MIQPANSLSPWEAFQTSLREFISDQAYNTWFKDLSFVDLVGRQLVAIAPEPYFLDYVTLQFGKEIQKAAEVVLGEGASLSIKTGGGNDDEDRAPLPVEPQIQSLLPPKVQPVQPLLDWASLNPKYRFDNFIEGDGNRMARSAGMAVANNPGETIFNPLFIYGDVGLGKTHLVQAIGNVVHEQHPEYRVLYLSSDTFYHHFIEMLRSNRSTEFNKIYRNVNVLILDDVQFLTGKTKTQLEFFHTFNTLYQAGRQIILSSDRPPKDLEGMEFRLVSRLGSGFTIDLQPLDEETRMAILHNRAEEKQVMIPDDVIRYIANNITSNNRDLERALIHVMAMASLTREAISMSLARRALKRIITQRPHTVSIDNIQKVVGDHFGLPDTKLREKVRTKQVANARHIAMYLSHRLTNFTKKDIGQYFGGKDHSSVIYAIQQVDKKLTIDDDYRLEVEELGRRLKQAPEQ